jgi:hypothetical protein
VVASNGVGEASPTPFDLLGVDIGVVQPVDPVAVWGGTAGPDREVFYDQQFTVVL